MGPLIKFAVPVLLAIFLQTMYGAVDMLIVGQFSSAAEVSAVSTGGLIMQTITAAMTGLSMGTTVVLGVKIGENKASEGGAVIGSSVYILGIISLVITGVMLIFAPQAAAVMQAPPDAFASTVLYTRICAAGTVFIVAYNVIGSVFRGLGNSKLPLVSVAIACVLNILGDLLLVAAFHLGAAGAAAATVASQAFSVVISLLIARRHPLPFTLSRRDIRFDRAIVGRVVRLGLPIALQDILVSISFLTITAIVNSLGVIASAGVGVAEKICGFVMLVPSAYMQAMSAFVAQNMGAKRPDRARKALFYAVSTSLLVGLFLAYFAFFHGDLLAGAFARDASIVAAGAEYLKAYAVDCLLVSFLFCFVGYFNGCGKTTFVMVQGIIGAFLVRIPVSFLMSRLTPVSLFLVGLATPCSTVIQVLLCLLYFGILRRAASKERPALTQEHP